MTQCVDGWWCWLSWSGWAGIGGSLALLGLVAALIFGVLTWASTRPLARMYAAHPVQTVDVGNGKSRMTVELSAVGPEALYELDVTHVKTGLPGGGIAQTTPVLRVDDPPINFEVTYDGQPQDNWIVLEWWEPRPRGEVLGASRFNLSFDTSYYWKRWRFPVWPLKYSGRWVRTKKASSRMDIDRRAP